MAIQYSYNQVITKTIVAFGTLFNNIYIRHKTDDEETYSFQKVPLAYAPIQQFLARLEQKPDPMERVALTLPRMAFELGNISYDASRKSSSIQSFKALSVPGNNPLNVFMPVPYDLTFELSIFTKLNDDMFQILEQILPIFKPEYTLTVNLVETIGEKKDIPIVIQAVSKLQDNYEGDFTDRRFIRCDLTFLAKVYFYGPLPNINDSNNYIKRVQVDYYTSTDRKIASRERRFVVTPRAVKDYDQDATTVLSQDITQNMTVFRVDNSSGLQENMYIQINNENMYIKSIDNNILTVTRGLDTTPIENHNEGDAVNVINYLDDELIIPGEEFEFNEEWFDFGDGKNYSPSQGIDV